jgi:hypothetical protein
MTHQKEEKRFEDTATTLNMREQNFLVDVDASHQHQHHNLLVR